MNRDKMIEWIVTHSRGISSRTMWAGLMGVAPQGRAKWGFDVPYDCADLSRCVDLVDYCEIKQDELPAISTIFPWFAPIISRWPELYRLFRIGSENRKFQACQELLTEAVKESCAIRKKQL